MENKPQPAIILHVDDIFAVSIETYEFILSQAKERFEDLKATSEAITKRCLTISYAYVAALSA